MREVSVETCLINLNMPKRRNPRAEVKGDPKGCFSMAATLELGVVSFILPSSQKWKAETTFATIYTNQLCFITGLMATRHTRSNLKFV